MSRKKSLLVRRKALKLFVKTLTADDKFSILKRDNLTQPIRTKLSQKQKLFSELFLAFSKSTLNFEHFQKQMTVTADFFPKIRNPENMVRYMSKKSPFKGRFDREHGKRVQTL